MSGFTEILKDRITEVISDHLADLPFQNIRDFTIYMESEFEDSLRLVIDVTKIAGNELNFTEDKEEE